MIVAIPNVLSAEQVAHARSVLEAAAWVDGKITAGAQSAHAKNNLQVPEGSPASRELGEMILQALGTNETFVSAALPLRVFPPLFKPLRPWPRFWGAPWTTPSASPRASASAPTSPARSS